MWRIGEIPLIRFPLGGKCRYLKTCPYIHRAMASIHASAMIEDDFVYDIFRYLHIEKLEQWTERDSVAMMYEDHRVATLMGWPYSKPRPDQLAMRGFYSRGNMGQVYCAFCSEEFSRWSDLDCLLERHAIKSPLCCGIHSACNENIPIYNKNGLVKNRTEAQGPTPRKRSSLEGEVRLKTKAKPTVLRSEKLRLETYTKNKWKWKKPSGEDLASQGFVCLDPETVRCVYCTTRFGGWHFESVILLRHRNEASPGCPFIHYRSHCDNEPLQPEGESTPQPAVWHLRLNQISKVVGENQRSSNQVYEIIEGDKDNKGDHRLLKQALKRTPYNLHMTMLTSRIKTYRGIEGLNVDVKTLAVSGFYYHGPGDFVRCYACNGGLQDWTANEDPWERHAGFYSSCLHVNHHKDETFIERQSRRILEYTRGIFPTTSPKERVLSLTCRCCGEGANVLFMSCGHVSSCMDCNDSLSACPQCKEKTAGRLQVFL
jgi:hypothetical protein